MLLHARISFSAVFFFQIEFRCMLGPMMLLPAGSVEAATNGGGDTMTELLYTEGGCGGGGCGGGGCGGGGGGGCGGGGCGGGGSSCGGGCGGSASYSESWAGCGTSASTYNSTYNDWTPAMWGATAAIPVAVAGGIYAANLGN
jgi:hypothetical protein